MVDTSNMILVVAALLIFGIVLTNTLPIIFGNQQSMVRIEQEAMATSMAEEIIREMRSKTFNSAMDENSGDGNWPEDFNNITGSDNTDRDNYSAMDHYHNHTERYESDQGVWDISIRLCFAQNQHDPEQQCTQTDKTIHKYMTVRVEAENTDAEVELSALRTLYGE